MDSYTLLLKQIMDNTVLKEEVLNFFSEQSDTLNLISLDWEERLNNNLLYQEFCEKSGSMFKSQVNTSKHYHYEHVRKKPFNVLVLAECKFPKKFSKEDNKIYITTINSKPLEKIARAMYSDIGPDFNLSNEFKFNFNMCSPLSCFLCKDFAAKFNEMGYEMKKMLQPCISNTRIFDGKNIVNRFVCHIENMLMENFIAILSIKLETRYDYTMDNVKCYRIGGKIQDILAFQESKLSVPRSINMGHVIDVKIELPKEENPETPFKLPESEFDEAVPKKHSIDSSNEEKSGLDEDKLLDISKSPKSAFEFDEAVPKKRCIDSLNEENLGLDEDKLLDISKSPKSAFEFDAAVPKKRRIDSSNEENSGLDEDKLLDIFKLPESSLEFDAAVPLNQHTEEDDFEVEEREEYLI